MTLGAANFTRPSSRLAMTKVSFRRAGEVNLPLTTETIFFVVCSYCKALFRNIGNLQATRFWQFKVWQAMERERSWMSSVSGWVCVPSPSRTVSHQLFKLRAFTKLKRDPAK